jgi:geranylgeranyl reductase family protein
LFPHPVAHVGIKMNPVPPKCFDAAVVGAGPAGSSAALALARQGYTVLLLEKASLPRYKTCGGGVLARAYQLLPASAHRVVERSFQSVALNFHGPALDFVATRTQPVVYMTMRAELDGLLAGEAQKAGAQLVESCLVRQVKCLDDCVEIVSERETHRAKFLVAADGVHSPIARTAGWPGLTALAPALEYELHLEAEDFARHGRMPRFDFNTLDAGYAWVFPKRTHLSVGILSTHRVAPELPARLAEYLQRLGITRVQKTERHGYLIPLAPRRGPLARSRILLTGDAAGLADPVTAEGITHAILSGQLAAAALIEARLDVAKVAPFYQAMLEKNILSELRAGRFLARLLYRHPRIRNAAFRLNGQRLCEFVTDVVMGHASYREAIRRPASYFKLLGL